MTVINPKDLLTQPTTIIVELMDRLWDDNDSFAKLLKGKHIISGNYKAPEITLAFLQSITTQQQISLINQYLDIQQELASLRGGRSEAIPNQDIDQLQTAANNLIDKIVELLPAQTSKQEIQQLLEQAASHVGNVKNILGLKLIITGPNSLGLTDVQLAETAAGKYDDFFIMNNTYGKAAQNISHKNAQNTPYPICNALYTNYKDSKGENVESETIKKLYDLADAINGLWNSLAGKESQTNSADLMQIISSTQVLQWSLDETLDKVETINKDTKDKNLQALCQKVSLELTKIRGLLSLYSFSLRPTEGCKDVFTAIYKPRSGSFGTLDIVIDSSLSSTLDNTRKQTFGLIKELISSSAKDEFIGKIDAYFNLHSDISAHLITENQLLMQFCQKSIETLEQDLIEINAINSTSELIQQAKQECLTQKQQLLGKLQLLQAKTLLNNKELSLLNNSTFMKRALPAKVWMEYLGLDNNAYLEPILNSLCQKANEQDAENFLKLANANRTKTLPEFSKALNETRYATEFFKALRNAPNTVPRFNREMAKLKQNLEIAEKNLKSLHNTQRRFLEQLSPYKPYESSAEIKKAETIINNIKQSKQALLANPLKEKPSLFEKALNFFPNLVKNMRAWWNSSSLTLNDFPHPTLRQIAVESFEDLQALVNCKQKLAQLDINQLFNLLNLSFLDIHSSEPKLTLAKIKCKNEISSYITQQYAKHTDLLSKDNQSIYALKFANLDTAKLLDLIKNEHKNPYVLRHIEFDALDKLFKDKAISLSNRLFAAKRLRSHHIHFDLCTSSTRNLRQELRNSYLDAGKAKEQAIEDKIAAHDIFKNSPIQTIEYVKQNRWFLGKDKSPNIYQTTENHIKESLNATKNGRAQLVNDFCRGLMIKILGYTLTGNQGSDPITSQNTQQVLKSRPYLRNPAFQNFCRNYHQVLLNASHGLEQYLAQEIFAGEYTIVNEVISRHCCEITESGKVIFTSERFIDGFNSLNPNDSFEHQAAPCRISLAIEFTANNWKINSLTMATYAKDNSLLDSLAQAGRVKQKSSNNMTNKSSTELSASTTDSSYSSPSQSDFETLSDSDDDLTSSSPRLTPK
jgi:hypothetical protein